MQLTKSLAVDYVEKPIRIDAVAAVVAFIASPAASGVHGAMWTADGGVTAGRSTRHGNIPVKCGGRRGLIVDEHAVIRAISQVGRSCRTWMT